MDRCERDARTPCNATTSEHTARSPAFKLRLGHPRLVSPPAHGSSIFREIQTRLFERGTGVPPVSSSAKIRTTPPRTHRGPTADPHPHPLRTRPGPTRTRLQPLPFLSEKSLPPATNWQAWLGLPLTQATILSPQTRLSSQKHPTR